MTRRPQFTYEFARKQMMVDAVVGGVTSLGPRPRLQVLLIRRGEAPYKGWWALPGGHNEENESFERAVVRELKEETNVEVYLVQFHTFSDPGRDPRGDTGTVAYFGVVRLENTVLRARSDAKEARWFHLNDIPTRLAFDHRKILRMGLERMRESLWDNPDLLRSVLPERFTIGQLHAMYEQIRGEPINRANFRRDYLKLGFLEELEEIQTAVKHRPPKMYRFKTIIEPV